MSAKDLLLVDKIFDLETIEGSNPQVYISLEKKEVLITNLVISKDLQVIPNANEVYEQVVKIVESVFFDYNVELEILDTNGDEWIFRSN